MSAYDDLMTAIREMENSRRRLAACVRLMRAEGHGVTRRQVADACAAVQEEDLA